MLIKYWATATASGLPLIVIVLSVLPASRSSQFEIRIMAPEICRISAILVPPLPIMQPIRSFGTVISCCCVLVCCCCWGRVGLVDRSCEPASAASAVTSTGQQRYFPRNQLPCANSSQLTNWIDTAVVRGRHAGQTDSG